MGGLVRLIVAGVLGAVAFSAFPRVGVLAATQEIIATLGLFMAGLFPTMLLTATVLRAGTMSARRVGEYGAALRAQMHFWTGLFTACFIGTAAIIVAKIFVTEGAAFSIAIAGRTMTEDAVIGCALALAGFAIGVVMQRLPAAYEGILSLLSFNVQMAQNEASAADKKHADAFVQEATTAAANLKRVG